MAFNLFLYVLVAICMNRLNNHIKDLKENALKGARRVQEENHYLRRDLFYLQRAFFTLRKKVLPLLAKEKGALEAAVQEAEISRNSGVLTVAQIQEIARNHRVLLEDLIQEIKWDD